MTLEDKRKVIEVLLVSAWCDQPGTLHSADLLDYEALRYLASAARKAAGRDYYDDRHRRDVCRGLHRGRLSPDRIVADAAPGMVRCAVTPRYKRAREMAGLTLGQATRLLSWHHEDTLLERIESGQQRPSDELHIRLAKLYAVTPAWLRGAEPVVPASMRRLLEKSRLGKLEVDELIELLGAIYTPEPR